MTMLLEATGLVKRYGALAVVNGVGFHVAANEAVGIVGPNGAGKTSFFNLLSGQLRPTAGSIHLYGQDVTALSAAQRASLGIGRAFQLTTLFPALSVLDNVRLALERQRRRSWRLLSIAADDVPGIEQARHWLGRTRLLDREHEPAAQLSHGDQRKLEVAMLLAMRPRVFMFDEPTAGMSVDEVPVILELIQEIKDDPMNTVLLVEHKIQVVRSLADRILVLHNGELLAQGDPAEVMDSPLVREAYLGLAGARS